MKKINPSLLSPSATTKSFNSIINRLSSQGAHHEVLFTFSSMLNTNAPADRYTFPSVLKACASLELLSLGLSVHQRIIINGFSSDPYIASSLVHFYAKFGRKELARKVFDLMPERDVVPWTSIIGCYAREGEVDMAFCMFNEMRYQGIKPSSVTLLEMLSGMSKLKQLQCLHGFSIFYGFESEIALGNSMLSVYSKCRSIKDGRKLFELMHQRDMVSWNSLISGYSQIGGFGEILQLLCRMRSEGMEPDQQTFVSLVSATATRGDLGLGRMVHGQILRGGFDLDAHVKTSLIAMYLKCGEVNVALQIFEVTSGKDVVLWTSMISGLVQNDCAEKALIVFSQMLKSGVEPSTATIASVLAGSAQLGSFSLGTSIHGFILRQGMKLDIPTLNSLLTMYGKCGHLEQSLAVFEKMDKRDLVSWNAIIAGYTQNGHLVKALLLFNEMRTNFQRPNSLTVVSLLQACASTGALHQGKFIHSFAIRNCLTPCNLVDTALVGMYSKCGDLNTAQKCFDEILHKDLISWGTILAGYGYHGKAETVLRLYSEFQGSGLKPNHAIFLSVLSACSHNGLVHQGLSIFKSMTKDFGLEPKPEHHACIIDLLCRAGRVEEAYQFCKENFSEPTVDVLGILLDACRANGNTELGDIVSRDVLILRPENAGNYVRLAHCFASVNRWDKVGEAWTQMRALGLKKLPGWSFIEISGAITTFFVDHNSHARFEEIELMLKTLSREMRKKDHQLQEPNS